jgi:undecaprenyl-diphosphatase
MPSGHSTIATTVFMGIAFLFASYVRPKYRWLIYTIGIIFVLLIGISRLYLGAHWFTDVLAAWLLGAAVLMFVIISYDRQREAPINPLGMTLVIASTLMFTFIFYHYTHFAQLKTNFTPIDRPAAKIAMNLWWQKNDTLPAYRVSLFGVPSQAINIVWAGHLDKISETLMKEGWTKPPARDWISTLHRIADIKSTQYLSMVSPQYLDKQPELIMVRSVSGLKGLIVIRLWNSNHIIKETHSTLWVGTVGVIPRSYSWLYRSRRNEIDIDISTLFPSKTGLSPWEWKIMISRINQKIMLLREKQNDSR